MNISGKGWRVGPPARHPTGRAKKTTHFALSGQSGLAHLKRAKKRAGPKRAGLARFDTPSYNY